MIHGPLVSSFGDKVPVIHRDAYVDVSARLMGDVRVGPGASVWPMAVLRATGGSIRIGEGSAVLDGAILESPEDEPVEVENGALVSHGAVVHGARVEHGALVGIRAVVLDRAVVGHGSIIGAGSIVVPGMVVPPDSLVLGVPGTPVRKTTPEEQGRLIEQLRGLSAGWRELTHRR